MSEPEPDAADLARGEFETKKDFDARVKANQSAKHAVKRAEVERKLVELDAKSAELGKQLAERTKRQAECQNKLTALQSFQKPVQMFVMG